MEMIVLSGVQATGKSSFYKARYFRTHVRVSLDQLRTRNRERELVALCLRLGQPLVVDNTNVTRVERAPGRLTDTAVVRPAVDLATIDVVAVVTGPGRTSGRTP